MGLLFSAASTAYTGLAFNEQTTQQRQQATADASAQAAQVNVWLDAPLAARADERAIIDNNATLPLYQGTLYFKVGLRNPNGSNKYGIVRLASLGVIAPCTRTTVNLTKAISKDGYGNPIGTLDTLDGLQLSFWDAAGRDWLRDTGLGLASIYQPRLVRASSKQANSLSGKDRWGGAEIPSGIDQLANSLILVQDETSTTKSTLCGMN
ncbi:hypothetical protein ACFO3J_30005 [Streptomyces polygonati]|uniref:Uncharacterized protein n=1 Tax=Streptomyces polygonati TaxID=1617087 RepID=A0ABV8HXC9_9ACTN